MNFINSKCSTQKTNKKSELMLMRRTRAYSSSCSKVILVYLLHFIVIHSLAAKNRQKSLKSLIFRVQGQSRSSMLTILRSMSVPICNHFHVRQASSR